MEKLLKQLLGDITLFKLIIIVATVMFLIELNDISKNGRYEYTGDNSIIDTRTGYILPLEFRYDRYPDYGTPEFPIDYNKLIK